MAVDLARGPAAPVAVGAAAAAAAAYAALARPGWPLPRCPLHAATGLWCPFCGGTRAVAALARADPGAALRLDAAALPLLLVAVAAWCGWLASRAGWWRPPAALRTRRPWLAGAVVLGLFGVARNLPWLAVLAPHR
ncbi:MAG TPA: DUF2752 domain-containing protein [Acidimicrobiales bacterium]|nr:DUF2752 domain-containing protein [Acidimicrobiales bacterium]